MSLPRTIRHDQTTFAALVVCILISSIVGCSQILKPNIPQIAEASAPVIAAAATAAPPPYKELLIAISALLGSGIFVDNRRKDTVIKTLKKQNGANKEIIEHTLNPKLPDPPG